MPANTPFIRESGSGPAVVCLHSNASSSSQWRGLMDTLSPRFRVLAPDCYGAGKSADWSSDQTISLDDEADFLEPVLSAAGEPFFLVAHSYGAATALKVALNEPRRVRAMVLYEPTLFSLIDADSAPPNAADGIRQAVQAAGGALEDGDSSRAAKHFIDYWMGPQGWDTTPDSKRGPIAASVVNVRRWGHALFTEPTALHAFKALDIPVLYMVGKLTTQSALGVARLLTAVLPRVEVMAFNGLGHMGPVTHPELVNDAIAAFLDRQLTACST
ncbi:MAG: alpha/beta hydrolase [Polaromonas sp.]|nr:alpha/beta hydrolase [Polaromonas sp.]MDP3356823.1 alpha/beta hydrolase [Polaromonas sp.]MDP3752214.1 alpha/beta hydrolase [Polaromonas sp.]